MSIFSDVKQIAETTKVDTGLLAQILAELQKQTVLLEQLVSELVQQVQGVTIFPGPPLPGVQAAGKAGASASIK